MTDFERNKARVTAEYEALINRKNIVSDSYNGIYDRYVYPVLQPHTHLLSGNMT